MSASNTGPAAIGNILELESARVLMEEAARGYAAAQRAMSLANEEHLASLHAVTEAPVALVRDKHRIMMARVDEMKVALRKLEVTVIAWDQIWRAGSSGQIMANAMKEVLSKRPAGCTCLGACRCPM